MAQDTVINHGLNITLAPAQLLVLDIPIYLELNRGRTAFGLSAAYRHRSNGNYDHAGLVEVLGMEKLNSDFLDAAYRALTFGVNTKYYFGKNARSWYGDVQFFYRRWWDDKNENLPLPYYPQYYSGVWNTNVYGSKFLLGYTALLSRKGKVRPVIMAYTGLGLRLRHTYSTSIVIATAGAPKQIRESRENGVWPSFHLGINVGVRVLPKYRVTAQ